MTDAQALELPFRSGAETAGIAGKYGREDDEWNGALLSIFF